MPIISISSIDDPRLANYRDLNKRNPIRRHDRIVVEGKFLVRRLLESECQADSVLTSEHQTRELSALVPPNVPIYVVSNQAIREIVGFRFHRGVLACGRRPPRTTLQQALCRVTQRALVVICPRTPDPANLGSIIRNCSAFGVDALLLGEGCGDPFSRRSVRVSMGSALKLPIVESDDLKPEMTSLKERWGFHLVGTVLDERAPTLATARRPNRLALVFGSEGEGIDAEWLELCDHQITLPMLRGTDSLNVATATGVFLYHFVYQESFD